MGIILQRPIFHEPTIIVKQSFLAQIFYHELLVIGHCVLDLRDGAMAKPIFIGHVAYARAVDFVQGDLVNADSMRGRVAALRLQVVVELFAVGPGEICGSALLVEGGGKR